MHDCVSAEEKIKALESIISNRDKAIDSLVRERDKDTNHEYDPDCPFCQDGYKKEDKIEEFEDIELPPDNNDEWKECPSCTNLRLALKKIMKKTKIWQSDGHICEARVINDACHQIAGSALEGSKWKSNLKL